MNTMPKYDASTTLTTALAWRNSTLISSNVVEEIRALKAQPGKNIAIDGSSVLIHTLAEHDLIDEYSLLVYPLVLGSGKKLFPRGLRNLRLIESRPFPSGVVLMRYARLMGRQLRNVKRTNLSDRRPGRALPRPAGRRNVSRS